MFISPCNSLILVIVKAILAIHQYIASYKVPCHLRRVDRPERENKSTHQSHFISSSYLIFPSLIPFSKRCRLGKHQARQHRRSEVDPRSLFKLHRLVVPEVLEVIGRMNGITRVCTGETTLARSDDGQLTCSGFKVPAPRIARNLGLSMHDTSVK